jgi:hypothetical protein
MEARHELVRFPRVSTAAVSVAILVACCALVLGPGRAEAADPNVTAEALAAMPPLDTLAQDEAPLSREGAWAQLGWVVGPGAVEGGWGSVERATFPDGAYWTRSTFVGKGAGAAAVARLLSRPGAFGRYFALWLDMPAPQSVETGYQLRIEEEGGDTYRLTLQRWEEGVEKFLAGVDDVPLSPGDQFAIVDQGRSLSAWVDNAGWQGKADFVKVLSVEDKTFESGYAGMQTANKGTKLRRFKAGSLAFSSF